MVVSIGWFPTFFGNGCFTKHSFFNGCYLGFQEGDRKISLYWASYRTKNPNLTYSVFSVSKPISQSIAAIMITIHKNRPPWPMQPTWPLCTSKKTGHVVVIYWRHQTMRFLAPARSLRIWRRSSKAGCFCDPKKVWRLSFNACFWFP